MTLTRAIADLAAAARLLAEAIMGARDRRLLGDDDMPWRLNRTKDWWMHEKAALMRDHGFPPAVTGMGNRWDPRAVDAWLDAQMPGDRVKLAGAEPDWPEILRGRGRQIAARGGDLQPHAPHS